AYGYATRPFAVDEMLALVGQAASQRVLEREVRYLRAELDRAHGFDALVGRHPSMVRLYELISQVAQTPATVLIGAESGTGKELVARAIHRQSPRRDQPFVAVNLAAIPDTLVESELFGHEKGAFTGAHSSWPTAAPSSSTRWGRCGWTCRPSSCASSRSGRSSAWGAPGPCPWTCA